MATCQIRGFKLNSPGVSREGEGQSSWLLGQYGTEEPQGTDPDRDSHEPSGCFC